MRLVIAFISSTNQRGLGADGSRVKTRGPSADTGSWWRREGRGGARFGSASGRWLSGLSLRYLQLPFRTMHRNPPPPWGGARLLQPPYSRICRCPENNTVNKFSVGSSNCLPLIVLHWKNLAEEIWFGAQDYRLWTIDGFSRFDQQYLK